MFLFYALCPLFSGKPLTPRIVVERMALDYAKGSKSKVLGLLGPWSFIKKEFLYVALDTPLTTSELTDLLRSGGSKVDGELFRNVLYFLGSHRSSRVELLFNWDKLRNVGSQIRKLRRDRVGERVPIPGLGGGYVWGRKSTLNTETEISISCMFYDQSRGLDTGDRLLSYNKLFDYGFLERRESAMARYFLGISVQVREKHPKEFRLFILNLACRWLREGFQGPLESKDYTGLGEIGLTPEELLFLEKRFGKSFLSNFSQASPLNSLRFLLAMERLYGRLHREDPVKFFDLIGGYCILPWGSLGPKLTHLAK